MTSHGHSASDKNEPPAKVSSISGGPTLGQPSSSRIENGIQQSDCQEASTPNNHLSEEAAAGASQSANRKMAWVSTEPNPQDPPVDEAQPTQEAGPSCSSEDVPRQHVGRTLDKTTKMMLILTCVYFLTWIPEMIIQWSTDYITLQNLQETHTAAYVVILILRNGTALDFVINPIIYAFTDKNFRKEALKIFKK